LRAWWSIKTTSRSAALPWCSRRDGVPSRFDLFKDATTDQHGQFRLKGVAPGEYRIYAWDDVESGAWLDAAFLRNLEGKSETVTVEPKGRQKIELKVIAAEQR